MKETRRNLSSFPVKRTRPRRAFLTFQRIILVAELSKEADAEKVMAETVKAFGRLDILVNNAGVIEMGTIETTSMEQYDRVMNINVRAMYHLTMLATPHLIATKGNVVNISSVNGMRSVKRLPCQYGVNRSIEVLSFFL